MPPVPEFAQTLDDHLKYVGDDLKMKIRLETCYLLFIPFRDAYDDDKWEK